MKKVRAVDFDPNAAPVLESPLDGMPAITAPPAPPQPLDAQPEPAPPASPTAIQQQPPLAGDEPLGQSTSQTTGRSTNQPAGEPSGRVVARPKAFYITERLDRRLNEAVRYFKERGIPKVDRSTVLNAMLDNDEPFMEQSLERLADRVVRQLTSRLTD